MQLWRVNSRYFARKIDALRAAEATGAKVKRYLAHGPMNAARCAKLANGEQWADEIKDYKEIN